MSKAKTAESSITRDLHAFLVWSKEIAGEAIKDESGYKVKNTIREARGDIDAAIHKVWTALGEPDVDPSSGHLAILAESEPTETKGFWKRLLSSKRV